MLEIMLPEGRNLEHAAAAEKAVDQAVLTIGRLRAEADAVEAAAGLRRALDGTIDAMTSVIEMRDPYTAGHERRVTRLALAMAERLDLDEESRRLLRLAGAIHDVGKIGIPAEILSKPSALTEMEMDLVRRHPRIGHDVLAGVEFRGPVADIVLQHHERLDGSGYPEGLSGDEILPEARILAVADVVEAMASHRPYRAALGVDAALEEIERGRGALYDPQAVDACVAVVREGGFDLTE
jgi:HD-GYP domain-containing protein (c-di-GMP phosphodiesterase class II)